MKWNALLETQTRRFPHRTRRYAYQNCICAGLNQLSQQKGTAKGKGVAGTVRDAVRLQKEALRKNLCQPIEGTTSAPPTKSLGNREFSEDDEDDGGGRQGVGESEGSVEKGKRRADNEAVDQDSTKRKTPAKGNFESDSSESPPQQVTCFTCVCLVSNSLPLLYYGLNPHPRCFYCLSQTSKEEKPVESPSRVRTLCANFRLPSQLEA